MYLKGHFIILLVGGLSSLPGALPEALWVGSFTTSEVRTAESAPQPHVAVVSEEARVPGRAPLLCYLCWWVIVIKTKAKTKKPPSHLHPNLSAWESQNSFSAICTREM